MDTLKPEDLKFKPAVWMDDSDGGSLCLFHGYRLSLDARGGKENPRWTVSFSGDQYGYVRGGQDGERTLSDIKILAEEDAKNRIRTEYQNALDIVEQIQRVHG